MGGLTLEALIDEYQRLIKVNAALLEALERAENVISALPHSYGFEYDVLRTIRAAIAQAKGESK